MSKILIATRNDDKYKIVSELLKSTIFEDKEFYYLKNINEQIEDNEEKGDIINRSYEKAKNILNNIKNNDFQFIVGVDDGIKIKDKIIENVKDYINSIINGELLKENEIVYIVRAYTFIEKNGKEKSIITEIPFQYRKQTKEILIKKDSYPLSNVLSPLDSSKVISEQSFEESNDYYTIYSKKLLEEVKEFFNDK
ncbi:MAG: hypothetical protein PUA68_00345 [Bacilli bacterium]|nr:hypothetical protein [Bacilli bacterium]